MRRYDGGSPLLLLGFYLLVLGATLFICSELVGHVARVAAPLLASTVSSQRVLTLVERRRVVADSARDGGGGFSAVRPAGGKSAPDMTAAELAALLDKAESLKPQSAIRSVGHDRRPAKCGSSCRAAPRARLASRTGGARYAAWSRGVDEPDAGTIFHRNFAGTTTLR
ncbi:MAG: hypothetical protein WC807_04265 [Hyphomicrobium sp.]|jgi:hypothetical protein